MRPRDAIRRVSLSSLACLPLLLPRPASAQETPTRGAGPAARPELAAGRITEKIRLDGRLDEQAWGGADSIATLTQTEPTEGGETTGRTVVKVLADEGQIVIGIIAYDPDPTAIVVFDTRRDASLRDEDNVRIVLDPFLDGRSGVVFSVNPNGARYDALVSPGGENENSDWDAVWDATAVRTEHGWSAEIWIPIRSLTFRSDLRRWGFNVERRIQRLQESSRWASPERDYSFTQTSRAGLLTELPAFSVGVGLSVRPFVTGSGGKPAPGAGVDTDQRVGLDLTQRLGANLEATLTVNTDFGETETDARQTDLSRFPLFFPEKRAFFLQGSDIFDFGLGLGRDVIPFFSRRIGLLEGREIPLDGGTKLTGRIGNTNIGGLLVRTGDEEDLTPASTMGVVRVKQNVLAESSAGFIATAGDPQGRDGSWLAGTDFTYQTSRFLGDKNFLVGAWGLLTDRDGLEGDKSAFGLKVDYPNELWDASVTFKRVGSGFDPSLGFVSRQGTNRLDLGVSFSPRPGWDLVRQVFFQFRGSLVTRVDGSLESWQVFTAPINLRLESGDRVEFNVIPQGEGLLEPFEISDGVVIPQGRYDFLRYRLEARTASKRRLSGTISWRFGDFFTGTLHEIEVSSSWTPVSLFTFELSTETNVGRLPEGNFTKNLLQGRVRLNFSSDLELSSFIQFDNDSDVLGTNTRLRWTFRPVGELFVVYNHNVRDTSGGGLAFESNKLIVKTSYEFRF